MSFLTDGGWLSGGDLALESEAHFSAFAEDRLVPARARNVTTQLRKGIIRVWGVNTLHDAFLSLPTVFDSSFKEFFRLGRAMRVILPLGNGNIAHLFVICGYQGAESDPEKLQLSEQIQAAVLAEAKVCRAGQPVILVGHLNADPSVIPSLAKCMSDGSWIGVEKAFAIGKGVASAVTCQFRMLRSTSAFFPRRTHFYPSAWDATRVYSLPLASLLG